MAACDPIVAARNASDVARNLPFVRLSTDGRAGSENEPARTGGRLGVR